MTVVCILCDRDTDNPESIEINNETYNICLSCNKKLNDKICIK